jgi:hypothetical protein
MGKQTVKRLGELEPVGTPPPSLRGEADLGLESALRRVMAGAVADALASIQWAPNPEPPALVDTAALAKRLGICTKTVGALVRDGMPFVPVGGARRFDFPEVVLWLRERNQFPSAQIDG